MEKAPLYRKENKRAVHYRGDIGGEYRYSRNTKKQKEGEFTHQGMKQGKQRGLDYTPLFKFLLSKVGKNWDEIHSEAVSRLDKEDPIFIMVAIKDEDKKGSFRYGESTYYSGLFVDENHILQKVKPELSINDFYPKCTCCTHTFNGIVVTNKYINPL